MIGAIVKAFDKKFNVQALPYQPIEVVEAFRKVDRILDTAWLPEHVTTAENMFGNLLHRYGFTPEQRVSPLVVGMVERINSCRETVFKQWEANYQ